LFKLTFSNVAKKKLHVGEMRCVDCVSRHLPTLLVSDHTLRISREAPTIPSQAGGSADDRNSDEDTDGDKKKNYSVFIQNVPEDMHDLLELAIESQSRGTLKNFERDDRLNGVLATFEEAEGECEFALILSDPPFSSFFLKMARSCWLQIFVCFCNCFV
jgi:hypothetical protein